MGGFTFDLGLLANLVLLVCVGIFMAAVVLRFRRRRRGSDDVHRKAHQESKNDAMLVEAPQRPSKEDASRLISESGTKPKAKIFLPDDSATATKKRISAPLFEMTAKEMFARAVEDEPGLILDISRAMLEHLSAKGDIPSLQPQALERLAMQFALMEVAFRRASYISQRGLHTIPGETVSEILKEGFRLAAHQLDRGSSSR